MKAVLRKTWGHILVWGVLSVIFGIMAFSWPGLTLTTLVYLFAIAVIAEGIALLAGAFQARAENKNWWVILLTGVINVVVGIIIIANPGITALFFVILIGLSWLVTGLMEIYAAVRLRKEITNEGWLGLAGVLSVLAGLFLIFRTGQGALALVWLIASFAIVFGIILVMLALKAKTWVSGMPGRPAV